MANREQKKNREKKKPKAEKNKTKNMAPASPFASTRNSPPGTGQPAKKTP